MTDATADRFAKTRAEFPDFDLATLPAIPEGFVDHSWHNEICPCYVNEALGLTIMVDYPNAEDREFPESFRFGLYADGWFDGMLVGHEPNDRVSLYDGEDFDDLLAALKAEEAKPETTDPVLLSLVTDLDSAKRWIDALVAAGLSFHLEDNAVEVLEGQIRTGAAILFNVNRRRCYGFEWGPASAPKDSAFCPIGYMMSVEPFNPENQAPGSLPGVTEYFRATSEAGVEWALYDCIHGGEVEYGGEGRYSLHIEAHPEGDIPCGHVGEYDTADQAFEANPEFKALWDAACASARELFASAPYPPKPENHA